MKTLKTDVAVIGAGSAGLNAYRAARAAGAEVLMIEGGPYGTTCARVGCMPSKLLIAAAEAVHHADIADGFGVRVPGVEVDGKAVMHRVRNERDRFVGFVLESVENVPSEDRILGYARFLGPNLLAVGDDLQIEAERIVLATGSRPHVPDFLKPVAHRILTNDEIFERDDLPSSAVVFGTGVIALELAQALHRLRVRVLVLGRSGRIGPFTDPRVQESAREFFLNDIDLVPSPKALRIEPEGESVKLRFITDTGRLREESFAWVLVATGRVPNLDHLDLEKSGLALNAKGLPFIDPKTLQCSDSHIFIAGDITGEKMILHEASDEGKTAGTNAGNWPRLEAGLRRAPLEIVFTDPQMVMVGTPFRNLPKNAAIGEVSFRGQGRSRIHQMNQGLVRLYADRASHRFLGAEMFGPRMEHMGHLLSWAVQAEMSVETMLDMPFYHPVFEEGLRTGLRDLKAKL